ncbi:hypothetical protein AAG570_008396 [Ranatra chinensis]|uniref:Uncharacterized protein n=1 Tax=Ranatra chinensis TaxID=642074 RepID=A0ABD0YQV8_9HEMI
MMYQQVLLNIKDRKFQHIFWRPNPNGDIQEYELNTVTYGSAPSAFQALRVLHQLVLDEDASFPAASKANLSESYVDDIVSGAGSEQEAKLLQMELESLMSLCGFELRKLSSNRPSLLSAMPNEHVEPLIF